MQHVELHMHKGLNKFYQRKSKKVLLQLGQKRRPQVAVESALMMLFAAHSAPPLHSATHQPGLLAVVHALELPQEYPNIVAHNKRTNSCITEPTCLPRTY